MRHSVRVCRMEPERYGHLEIEESRGGLFSPWYNLPLDIQCRVLE